MLGLIIGASVLVVCVIIPIGTCIIICLCTALCKKKQKSSSEYTVTTEVVSTAEEYTAAPANMGGPVPTNVGGPVPANMGGPSPMVINQYYNITTIAPSQ